MSSAVVPLTLAGPAGRLEALWKEPEGALLGAAVVAHAHPLHGGTMHFKVVFRIARALARAGYGVLRFNFRGVGASQGSHDGGPGEREDFRAALDAAAARGGLPLIAAGFSFGATIALTEGVADPRVAALIGAGVPLTRWDPRVLERSEKAALLVSGGRDEFLPLAGAPPDAGEAAGVLAAAFAEALPAAAIEVVPDADHFFTGRLDALEERVAEFAASVAPGVGA